MLHQRDLPVGRTCTLREKLTRTVRRSVIDHDDLRFHIYRRDAVEYLEDGCAFVEDGNDDGEAHLTFYAGNAAHGL